MNSSYNFAFLDEGTKREIRRKLLKAVAIPGYQVPFGSRELPIARGWGTGGLQVTFAIVGRTDVVKVIDQGADDSVNACNLRDLIEVTTGCSTTSDTLDATIVQTRHRIPEESMTAEQILVFQVPYPESLRFVEPSERETRRMHAEADYSKLWVFLYEDIVRWGEITLSHRYPVMVNHRYIMDPSPIPRFDVPKLHQADTLFLFGAGREKRIYAIPPYTDVTPLQFQDYSFHVEDFHGASCAECGSTESYLTEVYDRKQGTKQYVCSDTSYCMKRQEQQAGSDVTIGRLWHA
ncbi:alpha-D-ribose 1-methylphosphonate 5-phosphate C-P-lyase PhnJ [Alicyclobacillus fastidiosus]|uniref:Alpha-D-ribose 1-methylphosphonate 5-phosphate C-P-lyase PhnJ n=1 Tax=Alicyclobacillus fastidiosus TaxID=392011 RepID=A0ABV5AJS3_9BACL|nr:alpha-D-ribose 1-methylphosphonate 5-phosphate C-P-lyase PhnJ [Alicyclobacillus fastidiosus]WEH09033.1 alpha-D-ribose 1-methylphosphonate 5-phosphate C-P-lyase PhnJ [Alicyclobacillus fastidiosus]